MLSTVASLLPPSELEASEMPPPNAAMPAMAPAPISRFLRGSRTSGPGFLAETPLATSLNAGPNPWVEAFENPAVPLVFIEGLKLELLRGADVENPWGAE